MIQDGKRVPQILVFPHGHGESDDGGKTIQYPDGVDRYIELTPEVSKALYDAGILNNRQL